jgi:hypothetical protein
MGIIDDLKKQRKPDDRNLNNLVEKLYNDCLKTISFKNKNGITDMIYEVQYITPGYPLHDIEEVSLKLSKHFKKKGFKTTYSPRNKIYIAW